MKKLLIVANVDWFVISHRLEIAKSAYAHGWDVYVACEDTGRSEEIRKCGIKFIDFKFSRSGTNAFAELKSLVDFRKLYKKIQPDVVHHVTLKPVVYGSIVARLLNVKGVVNAISGLGYVFTGNGKKMLRTIMAGLMRYGFKRKQLTIIFQNKDDYKELKKLNILSHVNNIKFIKGSGVNLKLYEHTELPSFDKIKILFPTRMLWDKGVKELRSATEILKEKYKYKMQFILAGMADTENKAGVPDSYLKDWEDGGYVKWIGYQKNMTPVYRDCHIVILPTYREGMPKSLLEACAIGRAIITTDAIGAKECVDEGVNGLKVPVCSITELATAIEYLAGNTLLIQEMGQASRLKAEKEFGINDVIKKHLAIYDFYV